MKLSSIKYVYLKNAAKMIILFPLSWLSRKVRPDIWIISERSDQARDNGYVFYKYMREQHPEQPVFYIIDKNSSDAKKIDHLGNSIQFDSWKHYYYYNLSRIHISAHIGGCIPKNNPFAKRMKNILGIKDVFLPHGVSYGISEFCLAKYARIDLFITSGKPEYENVLANYGYTKNQVVYTGFPRLDEWHDNNVNPNQILLMPTWRKYLSYENKNTFINTLYYKEYQNLVNDKEVVDFLKKNNLQIVFYLHNDMRQFAKLFNTDSPNIEVVKDDNTYDIQVLLKESALLITDYSSVHFDFAYMGKPVLYFQFDQEEFWNKQYKKSDFDAGKNGFGPVAKSIKELLENMKYAYNAGFELSGKYRQRMNEFYVLRDIHNCDRVYEAIKNHFGENYTI